VEEGDPLDPGQELFKGRNGSTGTERGLTGFYLPVGIASLNLIWIAITYL